MGDVVIELNQSFDRERYNATFGIVEDEPPLTQDEIDHLNRKVERLFVSLGLPKPVFQSELERASQSL